jgi:hypothetical protein
MRNHSSDIRFLRLISHLNLRRTLRMLHLVVCGLRIVVNTVSLGHITSLIDHRMDNLQCTILPSLC